MTPIAWLLALAGLFFLALGGLLPATGPRFAALLAAICFGAAFVLSAVHGPVAA